jgi:hypothetical protein
MVYLWVPKILIFWYSLEGLGMVTLEILGTWHLVHILQPIGISVYIILVYSMVIWYMYCSKNNLTTLVLRRIWNFCYKIDQARQSFLGWYNICTGTGIYISNMPDYNKIHHMAVKYTNWSYIYIYIYLYQHYNYKALQNRDIWFANIPFTNTAQKNYTLSNLFNLT